jgi:DNA-binding NarL/FixJ family response regulator
MSDHRGPIRLLVVDDHYVVRMGLRTILEDQSELLIVADAEDGTQAMNLFRLHRPDVTLMDLRMPGMSGELTTSAIRKEFPEARIIMLTTFDGADDIHRALQAGACGYVFKNVPGDELVRAINSVHGGERYIPAAVAQRLAERSPQSDLTSREYEVLQLLTKGLCNREIGELLGVSENTVKAHVKHIFSKLEVNDRTEAVTAAFHRGLVH